VAQPIEEAPQWVRDLLPSPEERAAQRAEAVAALDAIRRGDRSRIVTLEQLLREMGTLDVDAAKDDPGPQAT
jgi:hypothetical protein